jgi:tRNA pseudouridine38-40 synthase
MIAPRTHLLILAYRGTHYHGWQRQANRSPTIQECLEHALESIYQEKITVEASGRTDAGVHALAQVVAYQALPKLPSRPLLQAINAHLPPDIRVLKARLLKKDFHPRFDAVRKTYLYKIHYHPIANPFTLDLAWHQPLPLDFKRMRQAAQILVGRHDFSSFFTNPGYEVPNRVRTMWRLTISRPRPEQVEIRATADGFLHRMMRNIVGALIAVARHKITLEDLRAILHQRSRKYAPATAPAHGLYLEKVSYRKPSSIHPTSKADP